MIYINIKTPDGVETVDEFETMKEAKAMIREYRLSDSYYDYYLSQRSNKAWRLKSK